MTTKGNFFVHLATQGSIGFSFAPGTVATVLMLPVIYLVGCMRISVENYFVLASIFFLGAIFVVSKALPAFNQHDPSAIVLDEMGAFPFVFLLVPITAYTLLWGFCLFRFFDIVKPLGITMCERLPGVFGIMIDDIIAALFSSIFLYGIYLARFW